MPANRETIRLLGKVLREHLGLEARPSPELQALLLRLAVREAERAKGPKLRVA